LDQAVDLLVPIVATMRRQIAREKGYLRQFNFNRLDRVHEIREELEKVSRKLKPFMRLLTHVIEDDAIVPGATVYLRDVRDNLECADEDLRQLISDCHSLDSDSEKFHARQMDRTLYTLTVVSAVFLPAQFLTGVYGMNFSSMPELGSSWGYPMFWCLTAAMTISLLLAFNCGRLRNYS
jgi:Mg2+ and Co2+ transporter CorA